MESMRQEPSAAGREEEKSRPDVQAERQDNVPAPAKSALKPEPLRKKQEMPVSVDAAKAKKSAPAAPAAMPTAPASALKEGLPAQEPIPAALPKATGDAAADGAVRSQPGGGMPALRHNRQQAGAAAFGQWRQQLENGCREGRTSAAFWQEMERQGREVKARSGELQPDAQNSLENLLLLITGMETANVPERCRRINDLLAEERQGR